MTRPLTHGKKYAYESGCRCELCRAFWSARMATYRTRLAERAAADPSVVPHGTADGYKTWGCRCQPCRDARLADERAYTRRRAYARFGASS